MFTVGAKRDALVDAIYAYFTDGDLNRWWDQDESEAPRALLEEVYREFNLRNEAVLRGYSDRVNDFIAGMVEEIVK